jgi:hypothetical protein
LYLKETNAQDFTRALLPVRMNNLDVADNSFNRKMSVLAEQAFVWSNTESKKNIFLLQ